MLVRSFLSSFSSLLELLLGERIKFSFVVGLGGEQNQMSPGEIPAVAPLGLAPLPQDWDYPVTEQTTMMDDGPQGDQINDRC